ncbi:hypothetical protein PGB90_004582 [Kerria lacca]
MHGRKYQWLIMGTYGPQWWKEEKDSSCSPSELNNALEGCILTDYVPLSSVNVTGISGYVSIAVIVFIVLYNLLGNNNVCCNFCCTDNRI